MQTIRIIITAIWVVAVGACGAAADVNERLTFTNFTSEELYVELSVYDDCCRQIYDLYVWPNGTSVADFWADAAWATYSACAYGEVSGAFYGCINGGISDYHSDIYFDRTGDPYLAGPSYLPTEVFVFDYPHHHHEVVVRKSGSHHHASVGCFIGTSRALR